MEKRKIINISNILLIAAIIIIFIMGMEISDLSETNRRLKQKQFSNQAEEYIRNFEKNSSTTK